MTVAPRLPSRRKGGNDDKPNSASPAHSTIDEITHDQPVLRIASATASTREAPARTSSSVRAMTWIVSSTAMPSAMTSTIAPSGSSRPKIHASAA